jgi:hypothetical protein
MMADAASPSHDVFISYAGPDREIADTLGASLEAAEVGVWWDARLEAGEPFERQIQRALAEARIVVAVLSPRTLTSEWVRWELSQASRNGLHIVPLLVDDARPDNLPPPLHLLPTLSAGTGADAADTLVQQIRNCLAKMARAPNRPRENDARRRLASAAAATARQAADIKQRKGKASALPPIVVGIGDPGAATPTLNRFATSEGFAAFLRDQRISLAFTSSHTDELYLLGHAPTGQLVIDVQAFRKPTGLFAGGAHCSSARSLTCSGWRTFSAPGNCSMACIRTATSRASAISPASSTPTTSRRRMRARRYSWSRATIAWRRLRRSTASGQSGVRPLSPASSPKIDVI